MALMGNIIVAVLASLITFHLSMRRFRSDKIWEMKVIAYQRIIESLHKHLSYPEGLLHYENEGRKISTEERKKLEDQSSEGRNYISLTIRMGSFIISGDAINRLKLHSNKVADQEGVKDWYQVLDDDWEETNKCLNDVIILARKDLDQKKFWS